MGLATPECRALVARAVVSRAGACRKRRVVSGPRSYFDRVPTTIVVNVSRPVAQDILASKFRPDFSGQISQFAQICGLEKVSAGHLGEFGKQAGTLAFLAGAFHIERIKNSQRVKLTIGFLQKPAN